mmetsp:Transcript_6288/g.13494  ORF Transcript_6288/g.13494 Transcript_6288/m.13494 type:complete len:288 (+) Transcript_6288:60-923(+)
MCRLMILLLPMFLSAGYPNTKSATAFSTNRVFEPSLLPRPILSEWANLDTVGIRPSSLKCAAKNAINVAKPKGPQSSVPARNKGEPWYWIDEDNRNAFGVTYQKEDEKDEFTPKRISNLHFKVRGHPRPLQRHRTSRGHMYNPSIKYQRSFLDAFESLRLNTDGQNIDSPFFGATEYLAMTIIFRMKRPKSHFVNSRPGPDRLKKNAPSQLSTIRTDVDNLIKFVLDSMNGILYEDDRQVTSIHATKVLDNEVLCEGSIEVYVRSINDDDVEKILQSSAYPIELHRE